MSAPAKPFPVVLALGSAQTLAWGSTYYLPAILAEPMARDLEVTSGVVFAAFSVALVVSAFLGPVAGRRIDMFGGRDVLAVSSVLFALGLTILANAQGVVALFIAWFVIGVGMATGLYEAAFSTLAGIYGRKARGSITGITLIAGFASTVCWPLTAYLDAEVGWRTACYFWAAAHLIIGLPLNRLCVPWGRQNIAESNSKPGQSVPSDGAAIPRYAMTLLSVVFAVTWFISTAMAAHLPRLLQEAGASPTAAIAAAALVGPAQVAGRLLEFGILQRFHPLLSARLAAIAHPVGAVAIVLVGAPAGLGFAVLHGAGNGILTIAKGTLPLAIFGASSYGFRQGILMIPARFTQASAPFIFAVLIQQFGTSALLLSVVLSLIAFSALVLLKPSSSAEKP